jgi:hypothetical protein
MKSKKNRAGTVTGPLLKELAERQKAQSKALMQAPSVGSQPLQQPAFYQDPGSGYNTNFTFPQD